MSNHKDTHNPSDHSAAVLEFPDTKTVDTQASEWLAKLDAEQPSTQDLAAFKQWVNADPAHRRAFEELVEFWDEMNILTQAILPREAMQLEPKATKYDSSAPHKSPSPAAWPNRPILGHHLAFPRATFATAFLAMAAIVLTFALQMGGPTLYSTAIGEQKTLQLADNSTVQLNTNSQLEVHYSSNIRRLTLTQGEAHFEVAHNPERPFEVYVGNRLVRAIGTAFTVHVRKIDVEVIVTEGTVEIDQPSQLKVITNVSIVNATRDQATAEQAKSGQTKSGQKKSGQKTAANPTSQQPPATPIKASAGSVVTFNKELINDVEIMVASQLENELSWRQGMLVFKGEPLQNVVDEVSRYTQLKIIIPERSAREMKVGGLFKVGDTESLFEALRDGFDIHVKEVSDDVVYLISNENR